MDLEKLKTDGAIRSYSGIETPDNKELKNVFFVNSRILWFICENGVFCTPMKQEKIHLLEKEGFSRIEFFLPFDIQEWRLSDVIKWDYLMTETAT